MLILDYKEFDYGITCIDSCYQRAGLACCYLLKADGQFALIDTGTARTAPMIMKLLEKRSIAKEQVKYIIPTHVHLDHAGGAGQLMAQLPEAELVIHPYGARHMIDPAKLQAGAAAVYGEAAFNQHFDTLLAIPAARVIEMEDGMQLNLNGRVLSLVDTPGHARHHLTVWDEQSRGLFTGDVFGNGYPEMHTDKGRYLMPVTSPVQFDPPVWHQSIDKLLSFNPERVFLTHYGLLENPQQQAKQLHRDLDAYVNIALALGSENRYEKLLEQISRYHMENIQRHGCNMTAQEIKRLIFSDIELCAQGLEIWLQRQEQD
ncbi:MAG: MBL fold metallo-hydrolase [gamma proteobacterium symbiont of Taylorina sp.]|nr:MBL fold metallo-hydrolase [gamma proteobacterium symbiont of Taylorina sp.]